jgi:hypothetical protein
LAGLLVASAGLAQPAAETVEQIGGDAPPAVAVGQVSEGRRTIATPPRIDPPAAEAAPQVGSRGDSRGATPQLNREGRAAPAPAQLYRGGRTAQPSEPLSRPSEGRTAAVVRVVGEDRCDPAQRGQAAEREVCARVIETRAGEFQQPERVLSAEERLLIEQRLREQQASAEAAARRLAANAGDPDSFDEQAIAAVVLTEAQQPAPEPIDPVPGDTQGTLAEAIANTVAGTAPPPQ